MCKELVSIKKIKGAEDVFTNSKILAEGTEYQHHAVQQLIGKYKNEINEFGEIAFEMRPLLSGQNEKIYNLSEMQTTFLITLMKNNKTVVDFKVRLVKEFYMMRQSLLEKQSQEWLQTRKQGRLVRRGETDNLKLLLEYAIKNGSDTYLKQPNRLYSQYTKLVNSTVGIATGEREICTWKVLITLQTLEDIIQHVVVEEIEKETEYHEIYQICKKKCNEMIKYAYLPKQRLLK